MTLLDRAFPQQDLNYLVLDARTREVLDLRWPESDTPIPVGSLVKPFTALAFAGPFPQFDCKGAASACWLAKGHGRLRFVDALAHSCNAYFLNLARKVDMPALARVCAAYGVSAPDAATPEARIGLGTDWRIAPLSLTRAYAELASRSGEPKIDSILAGLERAAKSGTASAIGRGEMAKTGTAPCVEHLGHAGDGFTMVLDPAEAPRLALLARVHNVPGAEAAKTAARMLKVIQAGR